MAGRSYKVPFNGALSAAADLFEIVAPAAGVIRLVSLTMGQSSDYGDAQAEGLTLTIKRGNTSSGSGGNASVTPAKDNSSDAAAAGSYETGNTTQASGGTPETPWTDSVNVQAGYQWVWAAGTEITVRNSERMVISLSAPGDSLTWAATIGVIEE